MGFNKPKPGEIGLSLSVFGTWRQLFVEKVIKI